MAMARARSEKITRAIGSVVLVLLIVWTLAPLYWMVTTSLKMPDEIYGEDIPPLVLSSLGAYALTRLQFPGRRLFARGLVYTYLMPESLLFIPLLIIVVSLGLQNTHQGLVFAYLGFTVPFCTWLLMGYFMSIPIELEESAMTDGCSRLGVLYHIVLPLTVPALAVVAFFSFTLSWNEFIYASVLVSDVDVRTIPTGIPNFIVEDVFFWGPMMASTLISAIPPLVVYFFFQRYLITGLTLGAVKG